MARPVWWVFGNAGASMQTPVLQGIEINPKLVGAIFTDTTDDVLRVFCLYVNGDTHEFDVPVEENHESIHALYAQLDMLDKCNSAIVDQVVQGRIYTQDDKSCWMYTLLATQGSCAPRLNASIHLLRWKKVWAAKGTDVLLLGSRSRRNYCYAVRTEITEEHLREMLKQSRAFVHPVPRATRRTLPVATLVTLLLAGGALAGGSTWFHFRDRSPLVVHATPAKRPASAPKPVAPTNANYYVLAGGKIQGPLPAVSIRKLRETGEVALEALVRREGELDWCKLEDWLSWPASH